MLARVCRRRISLGQYGRAFEWLRCVFRRRIAGQRRKHCVCSSKLARLRIAFILIWGREGCRIEGWLTRAFIGTWASVSGSNINAQQLSLHIFRAPSCNEGGAILTNYSDVHLFLNQKNSCDSIQSRHYYTGSLPGHSQKHVWLHHQGAPEHA